MKQYDIEPHSKMHDYLIDLIDIVEVKVETKELMTHLN